MAVVAGHASLSHHHRHGHAHLALEQRAGELRRNVVGGTALAKLLQRAALEGVEPVRGAIGERLVGNEPVLDVSASARGDHVAQFERQRRRDRDRAFNILIIVQRQRVAVETLHARDHTRSVIAPDFGNHRIEGAGLNRKPGIGEIAKVEPDGDGQQDESEQDRKTEDPGPFGDGQPHMICGAMLPGIRRHGWFPLGCRVLQPGGGIVQPERESPAIHRNAGQGSVVKGRRTALLPSRFHHASRRALTASTAASAVMPKWR